MKYVAIAEKPSVAMEIAKAIGGSIDRKDGFLSVGDYAISWAYGHIIESAQPEEYDKKHERWDVDLLPFIPDPWVSRPTAERDDYNRVKKNADGTVKLDAGAVKQLNVIGRLLKNSAMVINAGDSAREGQLIVDEILEYHKYKGPAKRLWLQEMNLPAIKKALASMKPNDEYRTIYLSGLGRSQMDFLIGINCTRAYSEACKSRGLKMTMHIGRVQTPMICLVVARDLEIEKFVAKDYFVLRISAGHKNGEFTATWVPKEDSPFLDAENRVVNKAVVESVAAKVRGQSSKVISYTTTPKQSPPPLPFSLGDLQKEAFKLFGLSATETLDIAQALYEKHKLLTYPRTDYSHLPEGDHKYSEQIIKAAMSNLGDRWDFKGTPDFSLTSPAWNNSKIGDHFAIRPTDRSGYNIELLSPMEKNIYKLVVRQFLAQFYPYYKYDSTICELECSDELFKANGKVERQAGWKILFRKEGLIKEAKEGEQSLPLMSTGDNCLVKETIVENKKTSPPPRFDTALLLEAMEKAHLYVTDEKVKKVLKESSGIGTPATRAKTIEFALKREYLQEISEGKRKFFISTDRARLIYHIVPDWLKKPDLTAYFEELLKQVERSELTYEILMARQKLFIEKQIALVKDGSIAKSIPDLSLISQPKRAGKKGARIKSVGKVETAHGNGKKTIKSKYGSCPKCGNDMAKRKGANGEFLGCSNYPECKHTENIKTKAG